MNIWRSRLRNLFSITRMNMLKRLILRIDITWIIFTTKIIKAKSRRVSTSSRKLTISLMILNQLQCSLKLFMKTPKPPNLLKTIPSSPITPLSTSINLSRLKDSLTQENSQKDRQSKTLLEKETTLKTLMTTLKWNSIPLSRKWSTFPTHGNPSKRKSSKKSRSCKKYHPKGTLSTSTNH